MNTPGIDILSCGEGHMEIRFENGDDAELERAKQVITDMLNRGYALFIEGPDKALIRVESFDPKQNAYIITDIPEKTPEPVEKPRRGRPAKKSVPMNTVRATAIARSAGG